MAENKWLIEVISPLVKMDGNNGWATKKTRFTAAMLWFWVVFPSQSLQTKPSHHLDVPGS